MCIVVVGLKFLRADALSSGCLVILVVLNNSSRRFLHKRQLSARFSRSSLFIFHHEEVCCVSSIAHRFLIYLKFTNNIALNHFSFVFLCPPLLNSSFPKLSPPPLV